MNDISLNQPKNTDVTPSVRASRVDLYREDDHSGLCQL